jgi:hypothetical protein
MTEDKPIGGEESGLAAVRLAQEIRRRRTAEGLSQPDLAAMIGYTPQYVSLAERPRKGLPSATPAPPLPACDTRLPRLHQPRCVVCQCPFPLQSSAITPRRIP